LWIAAGDGHRDVVLALLEGKADPNKARRSHFDSPLYAAAQNGHVEIVDVCVVLPLSLLPLNYAGAPPFMLLKPHALRLVKAERVVRAPVQRR
jgi:ankyrin repeat protein